MQLLADACGQAIALNGRDCSVQRRHQKIIEEGPPVAAPPDVWKQMERAAVTLAKARIYLHLHVIPFLAAPRPPPPAPSLLFHLTQQTHPIQQTPHIRTHQNEQEVGYVNAGTVEYLFTEARDGNEASFFFLELNPRLQARQASAVCCLFI